MFLSKRKLPGGGVSPNIKSSGWMEVLEADWMGAAELQANATWCPSSRVPLSGFSETSLGGTVTYP